MEYTHLFRQLTETTRTRILMLLLDGPLCVCHLVEIMDEPQAKISKQLSQLRRANLLGVERSGNWSIYRINQNLPSLTHNVLHALAAERQVIEQFIHDGERREALIARLSADPGCCPLPMEAQSCVHC